MPPPAARLDDDLLVLLCLLLASGDGGEWQSMFFRNPEFIDTVQETLDRLLLRLEKKSYRAKFPIESRYLVRSLRDSFYSGRTFAPSRFRYYGELSRIDLLEKQVSDLKANLPLATTRNQEGATPALQDDLNSLWWNLSLGVELAEIKSNRAVPVRIYIADADSSSQGREVVSTVIRTLEQLSLRQDADLPSETGSWWKRLWVRTTDLATRDEVQERISKLERAAETRLFEKPQAEANKDHAAAVAALMKSLNGVNSACVQIGNLLLVKHSVKKDSRVIVRTLTAKEMNALERNQSLLKSPAIIIERLEKICGSPEESITV